MRTVRRIIRGRGSRFIPGLSVYVETAVAGVHCGRPEMAGVYWTKSKNLPVGFTKEIQKGGKNRSAGGREERWRVRASL